ncbi:MAG TPA: HAMP domain-containing sensor histidine kinase [Longimicrobiales bacterium]|nr:HAMP domain-containing sensor histidine kinase [Longimicrobiales bacterium]
MARTGHGSPRRHRLEIRRLFLKGATTAGASSARPWLAALLLGIIGYLLNLRAVPLLPELYLLLGSVPVLVAASAYGAGPGGVAALVAGARTVVIWGHPYGMLLLVGEAVSVGALRDRLRPVYAVGLYWLVFGLWLGLIAYVDLLGAPPLMAVASLLKQAVNGLGDALLAEGVLLVAPVRRALGLPPRPSVRHYLGVLAALAGGIPLVILWMLTARQQVETVLDAARAKVRLSTIVLARMVADDPRPELPAVAPSDIRALRAEGLRLKARTPDGVILGGAADGRMRPVPPDSSSLGAAVAARVAERVAGTGVPKVAGYMKPGENATVLGQASRQVLLAAEWVGSTGWLVWTELPYYRILMTLGRRVIVGEVIVLAALVVALFAAALVSRLIERPLSALVTATRRVAARDLGARLEPAAIHTMVPAELALLARRFDTMAARLQEMERERVGLLDASERRREEVERLMESRTRLIRGFSHDLKNPLGAADGYLALLQQRIYGDLTEEQEESVGRVRQSIGAALALIGDLVELARAEAGQLQIEKMPVDLRRVVDDLIGEYRAQADAAGLELEAELPAELPAMRSDPRRIEQVLGNLLSNAVKYTQEGGRVELRVEVSRGAGAPRPGNWVVVAVTDTGPGIPAEEQHRIFHEFVRLAPGRAPGAGLGLPISRRVAQALGGDLTFESVEGKGSTFRLWLPCDGAG